MDLSTFINDIRKYVNNISSNDSLSDAGDNIGEIINCPVFVVNLERSAYRRKFILNYLAKMGINAEVITAVEGAKLDLEKLKTDGIYDERAADEAFSRQLTLPEIGASLSHANIYKKIIDENIDKAIILEDDVMFCDDAANIFRGMLNDVPDDWDVIQLYYTCKDYEKITDHVALFRSEKCIPVGAPGYMIRRSGAKKILDKVYPVRYPADSIIGRSPRWGTKVYGSLPQLVILNNLFPTEIHQRKKFSEKLRYNVKQLIISGLSRIFS